MRAFGFSTGAVAKGDFQLALRLLDLVSIDAVELSALRTSELQPIIEFATGADLSRFRYVAVHAPAEFLRQEEAGIVGGLLRVAERGFPIVLHPDAIQNIQLWREFGTSLLVENMDKRKRFGRTAEELEVVFERLPDARMCFDIAHARQFDSSMTEAFKILRQLGERVRQVHISEVNANSKHDRITPGAVRTYQEVAYLIPRDAPVILETPAGPADFSIQLEMARLTFADHPRMRAAAGD